MAKFRMKRYGLVDLDTGEKYEGVITPWQNRVGGKWMRVFQDGSKELSRRHPELHGQSWRVLYYLQAVVEWGNLLPMPASVASDLGLLPAAVSRAYGELVKAGFVWKQAGAYYINPLIGWKGDPKQLEAIHQRMYAQTHTPDTIYMLADKVAIGDGR